MLGQAASWIGLLLLGLMSYDVLSYSDWLFEAISIGIAADAFLLALAIADRIRILRATSERLGLGKNLETPRRRAGADGGSADHRAGRRAADAELLATTDPLTARSISRGLFRALIQRNIQLAFHGRPLSLIIFDIDNFKRMNDIHGHAEGNRVLRQVVESVKKVLRTAPTSSGGSAARSSCW